jgi:hypothetical protein
MKSTDKLYISGLDTIEDGVENITFSQFISDISPEIDYSEHSKLEYIKNRKERNKHESKSYLE